MRLAYDGKGEHRPMRRGARSAKLWRRLCRLTGLSISAKRAAAWQARLNWREVSRLTRVTEHFGVRQAIQQFQ